MACWKGRAEFLLNVVELLLLSLTVEVRLQVPNGAVLQMQRH